MTDYKQLAKEFYETLKELRELIDAEPIRKWSSTMSHVDAMIERYETEVVRGTGRTTALYMKAIAEALANPGVPVEFQDHFPLDICSHYFHTDNLRDIITKLGYDIDVSVIASSGCDNKVILNNRFNK